MAKVKLKGIFTEENLKKTESKLSRFTIKAGEVLSVCFLVVILCFPLLGPWVTLCYCFGKTSPIRKKRFFKKYPTITKWCVVTHTTLNTAIWFYLLTIR